MDMKRGYSFPITAMDISEEVPRKVALVEKTDCPLGINLVNPKYTNKKAPNDLIELATEIQKSNDFVNANACNKLQMIAEQMRFLYKQAEKVLSETKQNMNLHYAACNFVKQPGNIYHLYQRESGQCYLSILSPEDWGNSGPQQSYKGSFRLEQDHSWTPLAQIHSKDNEISVINQILQSNESSRLASLQNYMSIDC
ncbi:uncharacterized protein C1orf50 homolog isoform X1 [Leptopilina boulardi]|uniref:uncharacterized protein C1orf50 homolog isoform X1 n=1 Tax=Leptopilina boulardi TaxID=63433 RepID=UPI0021F63EA2|nr:uncharacterized protein C1orf50 homolog isoform X1 [Leptopilina boulardi]XP_051172133.1 uncharacterized protein C1orf50 homolog isoform X1 [Leptopilina boulardi]